MSAADWNSLLPAVLASVREVDPDRLVVVGGADASSVAGLRQLELPADDRLAATVHYYEPFRFTHQGAGWLPGADAWLGATWGTAADRAAVTADLAEAVSWARDRSVPLYVGEFGVLAAADPASRLRWTAWVRHELERLGISWAYWDLATEFGAYDLERAAWDAELLDALLCSERTLIRSRLSEGGLGEQAEDGAEDHQRDQRGGERRDLGQGADRRWAAEGAEIADGGDGGDRRGWCGVAGPRGGAENGGSDGSQS